MTTVLRRAVHPGLHRDHHRPALVPHRARQAQRALAAAAAAMIAPDQRRSKLTQYL